MLEAVTGRRVKVDWVTRLFILDMLESDKAEPKGAELRIVRAAEPILDVIFPRGRWKLRLKWPGMSLDQD